MMLQVIVRQIC